MIYFYEESFPIREFVANYLATNARIISKYNILWIVLKQKLEYHYKAFDKTKLEPDPLQFPHLFKDEKDIEVMAFIASVFAYGNVKQIINSLKQIFRNCK